MKIRKGIAFASALLLGGLSLSACSSDEGGGGEDGGAAAHLPDEVVVVEEFDLSDSPTIVSAKEEGKLRVGVKEDQPGLGFRDAVTEERTGFDVDVARWMAAATGFGEDQIEFVAIPSANREQALVNGDIDIYVGTYSITDKRKEEVGFSGPYFVTGQGLLVMQDNEDINSEDDLAGKTVCSATGSTPIQNIKDNFKDTKTVEFETYSQCVDAMKDGQVDAVTTDEAILLGYASEDPENLKVVGEPFTEELYGIGVPKDDDALRHYLNEILTEQSNVWTAIYENTLGKSGTAVDQPAVDDY